MTNIKLIKTLTIGFVMTVSLCSQTFAKDEITCPSGTASGSTCWKCGDNCTAKLDSAGKMTISGTGNMYDYNDWYAKPWDSNVSDIKSVVIEKGITSVGKFAFWNATNMKDLTIPDSVTAIGQSAFDRATSLESLVIPDSVTSIGFAAFWNTGSLKNLVISDSVTTIGGSAFNSAHPDTLKASAENLERYLNASGGLKTNSTLQCTIGICEDVLEGTSYEGKINFVYVPAELKHADGSSTIYKNYKTGEIMGYKNKKYLTPAEAAAVVKKGNVNRVTLTFK